VRGSEGEGTAYAVRSLAVRALVCQSPDQREGTAYAVRGSEGEGTAYAVRGLDGNACLSEP